ncbi:MAG: hypothetical protein VZR27_07830 [Acutalibacteraceae bacterium]|nr:hypothetical protein [Acutalibacteraceae bacterium]
MATNTLKNKYSKKNLLSSLILSIAFSLTVFFFSPIDIYLANQIEFIVRFDKIIYPMLIISLISIVWMMCILILCLVVKETIFNIVKNLFFGLLCAMYIQMLFYNGRMTTLTGDGSFYLEKHPVYTYVNHFVFCMILTIPLILWSIKQIYPDNKVFKKIPAKATPFLCSAMIVMQLVGSVNLYINYGLQNVSEDYSWNVLSIEEAMKLSPNKNIIVFIADRLDSFWMDETLEEYPDLNELLEGFTFYQNNVSSVTNTFPGVPQLVTGNKYHGEWHSDYLAESWKNHNILDTFHENNYRINLLLDGTTTYNSFGDIRYKADNPKKIENYFDIDYTGVNGIVSTMTKLSMIKLLPYYIKDIIGDNFQPDFANNFFEYNDEIEETFFPSAVGFQSDIAFYDCLKDKGLNATSKQNTYNFIHLNFAHDTNPDAVRINPHYKPNDSMTLNSCIRGEFEILNEYFTQMKKLGIYDCSTIIIVGDHGRPPYSTQDGADRLDEPIVTSLLIKEADADHVPLKYDRVSELSNDYFPASVLEYAGLNHSDYGYSYNDIIKNNIHIERIMDVYNFRGKQPEYVCRYKITGDCRNFDNWQFIKPN